MASKVIFFFLMSAVPAFAEEENLLQGACGYAAFSLDQTHCFCSENEPKTMALGIDGSFQLISDGGFGVQKSGLVVEELPSFSQNPSLKYLSDISFSD